LDTVIRVPPNFSRTTSPTLHAIAPPITDFERLRPSPVMLAWPPLCLLGAQESVKPVPARSRFITEAQLASSACKSLDHLAQSISATDANPQLPYLARTSSLGYRNSNVVLCTSSPTYVIELIWPQREAPCRFAGLILVSCMSCDGPLSDLGEHTVSRASPSSLQLGIIHTYGGR